MAQEFDDFEMENMGEKYPEYEDMDIAWLENNFGDLTRERD